MQVGIREAAAHFNVSIDTIRRRIASGELPAQRQEPGNERSPWLIELPDPAEPSTPASPAPPDGAEVARLMHVITTLETQLESRTREISELHQLLAARMLPARLGTDGQDTPQEPRQESAAPPATPPQRPWWQFW